MESADDVINGAIGHFIHDAVAVEIIGALVYIRLQKAGYLPPTKDQMPYSTPVVEMVFQGTIPDQDAFASAIRKAFEPNYADIAPLPWPNPCGIAMFTTTARQREALRAIGFDEVS